MPEQHHSGAGDNVGRDKIGTQINAQEYNVHHHYPGDRKIRKHLTMPPFYPDGFLGRVQDFDNVHARLSKGSRFLLLMSGEGGIGKTSLASVYYHGCSDEYHHLAWILSQQSITAALIGLKEALGLEFEPTAPDTAKVGIVVDSLAQLDGKCLLVIDNANEMTDAEYRLLRKLPNFHLLLTTRLPEFQNAEFLRLDGLPYVEAHSLFRQYYPNHDPAEDGLFQKVYHAIWGNTLVIELIAKNLQTLNPVRGRTHYSLARLLEELEKVGLLHLSKQALLSTDYQADNEAKRRTIQQIVEAMYDVQALPEAEQAIMSVFAVLPAERIACKWLDQLIPSESLDTTLDSLAQKGWLDHQRATATFRVSPVVQEVTRHKNQTRLFADCEPLIDALIEKLDYDGVHITGSSYEDAAYYARLGAAVVPCFKVPENKIAILCDRLANFCKLTGDLTHALEFYAEYNRLKKELHEAFPSNVGFKNGLAISFQNLGNTHAALGDLTQALEFYMEYSRLEKELHETFPSNVDFKNNLAISFQKLGNTHAALGDLTQALEFYTEDLRLTKELHETFPSNVDFKNNLAISFQHLGNTHAALGDLTQALGFYTEYNRLEKELHEAFPSNVDFKNGLAISFQNLGNTHAALGDLTQALEFYTEYNRLEKELHETFPSNVDFKNNLAISFQHLGNTHAALGDLTQALGFYTEYNRLEKELHEAFPSNVDFKNGLAISFQNLGNTHAALGDLTQALEFYTEYNRLEKELHETFPSNVDFKNNLAISFQYLGNTHAAFGDFTQALEFYKELIRLEKELHKAFPSNVAFKNGMAISFQYLGNTHAALGDLTQALEFYAEYNRLKKELHEAFPSNVDFKNGLAVSYWKLGDVARQMKDTETARKHFTQAQQLWQELVTTSPSTAQYQRNLAEVQGDLETLGN